MLRFDERLSTTVSLHRDLFSTASITNIAGSRFSARTAVGRVFTVPLLGAATPSIRSHLSFRQAHRHQAGYRSPESISDDAPQCLSGYRLTKPSRLGMRTFGRVWAFMVSLSPMILLSAAM